MNKMANALDTSPPTYKQWELGVRPPRKAINRLAQLSGIPVDIWLSDEHELPPTIKLNIPNTPTPSGSKPDPDEPYQLRWRQFLMKIVGDYDSQTELADLIGVDKPTLSPVSDGKKPLTRRQMFRIGRATGNYGWYEAPQPADHEGARLRDYLDFHAIEQQVLAERLGYVKSAINSLLNRETIKKAKWKELEDELGVPKDTIMKGVVPSYEQNGDNETQKVKTSKETVNPKESESRIVYVSDRLKPYDDISTTYVSLRSIPGDARTGFNYSTMRVLLKEQLLPFSQLKRANNLALVNEADRLAEQQRYDVLTIGSNDYMLQPGQEILMYRLHPDQAQLSYPASRWSDEQGPMCVQTVTAQLRVGRVLENTLSSNDSLTFVTDDPRGGSFTVTRDQIVHLWKLESFVGGPVV